MSVHPSTSAYVRRKLGNLGFRARVFLRHGRLPEALVIGVMKSGTTSLFEYLAQHPAVSPCRNKEPQYFDSNFSKGPNWYRAQFSPLNAGQSVAIEASPHTMFHILGPLRVAATVPRAKLIAILRNPVDRAFSHYNHWVELGYETLPFEAALDAEPIRLGDLEERIERGGPGSWDQLRFFSYMRHGLYARQIERWFKHFPREQFLFLKSEDMFAAPQATLDQVHDFLGLTGQPLANPAPRNQRDYGDVDSTIRSKLEAYFAAPNADLEKLVGISWP